MANPVKNIIFDLGGVIFDLDFKRSYDAFEALGIRNVKEFFNRDQQMGVFDELEKGLITPVEFTASLRKSSGLSLSDEQVITAFNALLVGIRHKDYFDILTDTKKHFRTFLLSNNNQIHYNFITNYLQSQWKLPSLSRFFEMDYYSHLMGLRKPDKEIFEKVLLESGLVAEDTLFIDDSPQHIATAKSLGIRTYQKDQAEHLGISITKALAQ